MDVEVMGMEMVHGSWSDAHTYLAEDHPQRPVRQDPGNGTGASHGLARTTGRIGGRRMMSNPLSQGAYSCNNSYRP